MIPEKRIHLIPPVLSALGRDVRWTHLGDGPERARVEAASRNLPSRIEWDLPGHLGHGEVLDFYRSTPVDIFLSVSETEGVPVSMMEALSFGIPVVATDVGGVPEIVTPETGILVPPDARDEILSAALMSALDPDRFSPEKITTFFLSRFEARSNYGRFCDALYELSADSASPA
jgi:glycosyltransferase involved in cell wall biosynthesis